MKNSILNCVGAYQYQIVGLLLLLVGLTGIVLSRNLLKVLISVEFITNAINILFVSFASYKADSVYTGYIVALFTTGISALVMSIGIYLTFLIYKKFGTIDITTVYNKYKDVNKC